MTESLPTIIGQVATIALTAKAIHWLRNSKGALLPKTLSNGGSVYGIKWQWKGVGLVSGIFSAILAILSIHDLPSTRGWIFVMAFALLALSGLWLATGLVTTDSVGLKKRVLWGSRSFRWDEITEIRLLSKDIGAIDVRAGKRKLIIDSRFVGFHHMLDEITRRTDLQPIGTLPPSLEVHSTDVSR